MAGAAAGLVAWAVGPRAALGLVAGLGTAGGLLVLVWLRARMRAMRAELARLRSAQQELPAVLDRRLSQLEERMEERLRDGLAAGLSELAAVEKRLLAAHGVTERQIRAEVSTAEQRLRNATSGDLVALEKRLRAGSARPEGR